MLNQRHRETLRKVMTAAWGLFRADAGRRSFADALKGAWAWVKRSAERQEEAAGFMRRAAGKRVVLNSMVQSPIRRRLGNQPYAGATFARANYLTSRIGG